MLILGKIYQPFLLNSRNGLILLTDEKKDMVDDVYFNRIVTPTLLKDRGFKHRFMLQQPMMKDFLSEAVRMNNFKGIGQLFYNEYKKLREEKSENLVKRYSYFRYMEGIVLYSLAKIAFQQKDAEALYKIWRREILLC